MTDTSTEQERVAIDARLPITSSRNAKWWYSAFHNVTTMVGVGVLSLPYAMSELGLVPGVIVLAMSWFGSLYTLFLMIQMHEMQPTEMDPGRRFERYYELGQRTIGRNCGLYYVMPQQLFVNVGVNIIYMVVGGHSLRKFYCSVCENCLDLKLTYFIVVLATFHFLLSYLPNFKSVFGASLAAAVMSLSYTTIAWTASLKTGVQPNMDNSYEATTTLRKVFNFFSALGYVDFAHSGHNVALEIQATIPSTPEMPSRVPMMKGVIVAYIAVALCYFSVAIIGYLKFGNGVGDNILNKLDNPPWLIAMGNMFVVIYVIGSYQIFAMPVFQMIETFMERRFHLNLRGTPRLIARNTYVAFTMLVAILFPFFGGLVGFLGGEFFAITYVLPCIMWLKIKKPRRFSMSWFANWICIVLGALLRALPVIGGIGRAVLHLKHHKLFS